MSHEYLFPQSVPDGWEHPSAGYPRIVEVVLRSPRGQLHKSTVGTTSTGGAIYSALRRHPGHTVINVRHRVPRACNGVAHSSPP
ncbi:hypothetical protein HNR46_001317 [Haloferula luteola]|uniref:Uncharacterized protein n=1 Tax=Haloferula luteola TaxID=595692 RepID=A0A840V134_9BACT|nr:hypothetical protein [Haloferula luteola]MBB5351083.1 hypothetical protein [Haloferula luteola]